MRDASETPMSEMTLPETTPTMPEGAPAGLMPLSDPRLRAAIATEVAARRPLPVARSTLALMTESALLGQGLRTDASDETLHQAVRAVVDDLAARHPALFEEPGGAAAGPARSVPGLAPAVPTRTGWRLFARGPAAEPARPGTTRKAPPPRARTPRVKPPRKPITVGGWPLRDALLAAGALVALLAIGFVLASPAPASRAPALADGGAKQSAASARRDVGETGTVATPMPVSGAADVAGPAALTIKGRLVHLFGVEPGAEGQNADRAADLAAYLAGRPVACRPAGTGATYECDVEGHDLSEVVLFNGGAKAAADATPALVAAEDHARAQRLGLWRR